MPNFLYSKGYKSNNFQFNFVSKFNFNFICQNNVFTFKLEEVVYIMSLCHYEIFSQPLVASFLLSWSCLCRHLAFQLKVLGISIFLYFCDVSFVLCTLRQAFLFYEENECLW